MMGKRNTDFFQRELAAKYHADDIRIMETGQTEKYEEKYLQEGRETWVQTIKTVVRGKNGEVSGVCGVFWDITEHRRAEMALRELEDKFRNLAENSHIGINRIQDGKFQYINAKLAEIRFYLNFK